MVRSDVYPLPGKCTFLICFQTRPRFAFIMRPARIDVPAVICIMKAS